MSAPWDESGYAYREEAIATTSPRSFLYYIVADVGADGSHRPLAIAFRHGTSPDPSRLERVRHVLEDCVRIFEIFSEPGNRAALEAESHLAASWYRGPDYRDPDRVEIPDVPQPTPKPTPIPDLTGYGVKQELPEPPWPGGMREFPFISTCLRMGLSRRGTRLGDIQEQPLGTVFRDDRLEYGMVVFDISDLDQVRYGIVGFEINYMAEVLMSRWTGWDPVEGPPPAQDPVPVLERFRHRRPLTYVPFMKKFHCLRLKNDVNVLNRRPPVTLAALEYIWPESGEPSNKARNPRNKRKHMDSLDQEVASLTESLAQGEEIDMFSVRRSARDPEFQARLLHGLWNVSFALNDSESSTQLLYLAYKGYEDLNWVSYGNLTYESIATILRSNRLKDAKTLSICIDHLRGSPTTLFEALLISKSIDEIHFLQGPSRVNDELGSQLFAELCGSSAGSALLRERRIFLTCAYSAPLRRKVWLPDLASRRIPKSLRYAPPIHAFPVQHVFVRQQYIASGDPKLFRPCHFFLGDALLDPERFVVGFLQYCRSVLTDSHLVSFACGPPTISMYGRGDSGRQISPMAAENLAVHRRCDEIPGGDGQRSSPQVECWPMARDFLPGGWTVLVSHEWYHGPDAPKQSRPAYSPDGNVPFIRYAFLRTRQLININDETSHSASALDDIVGPDHVEVVGGLAEFFTETTGRDETSLINRLLEDAARVLKSRWPTTGLGPGMDYLSVLDESHARSILRDFIENTAAVRRNLKSAMEAKPEDNSWYPDLLKGGSAQSMRQPESDSAIFKSLVDGEEEDPNLLGPERKVRIHWPDDYDSDL
ncbi:hypothetical protein F5Y14DRAFT_399676 [Nemania sp. NC0429]|nr:hypothetical protein F5Y14DRAFT_399676 [Nemania sp. NC0429]